MMIVKLDPLAVVYRIFIAALAQCGILSLSPLRADTVFLKNGTQILDCQVKEETAAQISLRTPVGDMVVPRTEIYRIQRVKSVYDRYAEELGRIREGDFNGLFKLASWCRTASGLRKESDELLARVISLKEDHAGARRMLGHVKLGGKWVVPSPLAIRLNVSGGNAKDLRASLGLFLKTRQDVRLASGSESKPDPGDPLDRCTLDVTAIFSQKAASTFYGMSVGQPTLGATVRLQAQSSWLGKTPLKAAAEGQVPASGGTPSVAIQNAIGGCSTVLHKFLDKLTELRCKKIEEAFRKDEREKKDQTATNPKT